MSKAREAGEREAKALENYHSPRWQEHPQQWIVSAPAAQQARATACVALTTNVVFKFIDNEFLFRNQVTHTPLLVRTFGAQLIL